MNIDGRGNVVEISYQRYNDECRMFFNGDKWIRMMDNDRWICEEEYYYYEWLSLPVGLVLSMDYNYENIDDNNEQFNIGLNNMMII